MVSFSRRASALALIAVGFFTVNAKAASLNLISAPPDVTSNFVQATYDVTTHTLTATGMATQLTSSPGVVSSITGGTFQLIAKFTVSGSGPTELVTPAATGSSLSVTGAGGTHNYFGSTALQNFGFTTNAGAGQTNQVFEFKFGAGTGDYGGRLIGVILSTSVNAPYGTSFFTSGFNNTTNNLYLSATADTFAYPVPLPAAAYMGFASMACVPLILRRRRRTV